MAAAKAAFAQATPASTAAITGLKITYGTNARTKTRLEWFQQQWKTNLGVNVALDPVDSTTFTQLVKKPETLPLMFFLGWCPDYYDQQDWLTTVFSSKASSGRVGYNSKALTISSTRRQDPDAKKRRPYLQAQLVAGRRVSFTPTALPRSSITLVKDYSSRPGLRPEITAST